MSVLNEAFYEPRCFFGVCSDGFAASIQNEHTIPQVEVPDAQERKGKEELDALLSQAMTQLTFQERQEQLEIVHGVDQVVEDDAFIDSALQDLEQQLSSCDKAGRMFEVAERLDPEYVRDRAFRLMFLRANEYDPAASADQMLRFFDLKHRLFGEEKLTKEITMQDLDEDAIAFMKSGGTQLPGRDRSRRQIVVTVGGLIGSELPLVMLSQLRAQFYMIMSALKSEETQVRGSVGIWFIMGDFKNKAKGSGYLEYFKAGKCLPRKQSAIHLCVDEWHQALLLNAVIKFMKGRMRARLKLHFGSQMECMYQLSTYGIPPQAWPVDDGGRMKFDRHLEWVQRRAVEDSMPGVSPLLMQIDAPGPKDVIFNGGNVRHHSGTLYFRDLVEEYFIEYDSGADEAKRNIVEELIEKIHEIGGRFLSQDRSSASVWEEVPLAQVHSKIMQTFRNRRRRKEGSKQNTGGSVGTLIAGEPTPNDVLFGKKNRNPGTKLLHSLVKHHFKEYESLDRGVKIKLVETIMQNIMGQGGRFLHPADEPDKWIELSFDGARERVSKCFRNQRRYSKPNQT